jgi:hypothetical protein
MNSRAGSLHLILPVGLLVSLGLSALGFQYFALQAFDVGTDREFIPKFKTAPARQKCVKTR